MLVTESEITETMDKASDVANEGGSQYPGMTYEEGVRDALSWVLSGEENPMEDE
ncbi:MAG: hypothetical protein Unbinned4162contig1001_1 [Prokaryotic dsDNA virus sp.]|nr:MAG: hypothetical protein Unbinned4162contig1001_1 [Prokaryotic dsDNA virus sp.]|tara:strand:+ start:28008 stop:28169 length:162 start_codon:yes stop_codon:yes gene_type:complete